MLRMITKKTNKFIAVLFAIIFTFSSLGYAETTEGVIHANSALLPFTNAKIEHVYDKLKDRAGCQHTCVTDRVWAQYYYNTYHVNENETSPKFETNVNGILAGFDIISSKHWEIGGYDSNNKKEPYVNGKVTTNKWKLGIMAGYGISELKQDQNQDKTKMDDINLGFYGGYENENWLLKAMLLGGYEKYKTDRNSEEIKSDYNGYSAALDLEAGYKISLNKKDSQAKHKMYLKPFVGVTGFYVDNEDFEEKGSDNSSLKVEDNRSGNVQARGGIGITGKIKKFGWYAKAGIRRLLMDDYVAIDASSSDEDIRIRSAQLDKFSYGGGLGVDYVFSNKWTIFANGLANFAEESENYYGNIGLMYKFGCRIKENGKDKERLRIEEMLNEQKRKEEEIQRQLEEKERLLQARAKKEKELEEARARERELQEKIEQYKAQVISEQQAQKMKERTIKNIRLAGKPTFKFGTSELNENGKESLKQVVKELEQYPDASLLIEGHTDSIGSDEVNQKISEQRAIAMATSLKKDYGVENAISVIGKGEKEPIASNETEEGRAQNRRVEIILTTAE